MSFIPENVPFVSLPTALKGRISPHQLAVLWVLQSYYPNIWPSYSTIAKDAGMCRTKVIHTVEQLVSLGWLQKIRRFQDGKQTNAYRVTVWHECKIPAPQQPSTEARCISATSTPDELGRCISATRGGSPNEPKLKQDKLKQITKKKKGYSENFELFWKKYQSQNNKCVSQSKKPAFKEYQLLDKKTQDKLIDCLEADSRLRVKLIRDGNLYQCGLIVSDGLKMVNMNSF